MKKSISHRLAATRRSSVTALVLLATTVGCSTSDNTDRGEGASVIAGAAQSGLLVAKHAKEVCSCMYVMKQMGAGDVAQKSERFVEANTYCQRFASEKILIHRSDTYVQVDYSLEGSDVVVKAHGNVSGNERYSRFSFDHPELGCTYLGESRDVPVWMNYR